MLEGMAGGRGALAAKRIAILGAGGTGRTAVATLAPLGCEITIYNRTVARAEALAAEFGRDGNLRAAPLEEVSRASADVYVNTTSVGLQRGSGTASPEPGEEKPWPGRTAVAEDAFPALPFAPGSLAFDVIYNPPMTPFLRAAAEAGAKTLGGAEMFLHQASAQFRLWTGLEPPTDPMRRAFEMAFEGAHGD
jgi:shikimate 5-dehydrogenase